MNKMKFDQVNLAVFETRAEMGAAAARDASDVMKKLLREKDEIHCVFAAAPSQREFLEALVKQCSIDWSRVNAYHMDEYIGLEIGHEKSFNEFLTKNIFSKVPFKTVNLINGANNVSLEAKRYSELLDAVNLDIVFMGIGENGHIAFNDPGVADFHDKETVKVVALDEICRQQQVNDGCFAAIEDVPKYALTVTIPKLTSAKVIFCIVPSEKKRLAVKRALMGTVCEECPASILRLTSNVNMYIDRDCYWNGFNDGVMDV